MMLRSTALVAFAGLSLQGAAAAAVYRQTNGDCTAAQCQWSMCDTECKVAACTSQDFHSYTLDDWQWCHDNHSTMEAEVLHAGMVSHVLNGPFVFYLDTSEWSHDHGPGDYNAFMEDPQDPNQWVEGQLDPVHSCVSKPCDAGWTFTHRITDCSIVRRGRYTHPFTGVSSVSATDFVYHNWGHQSDLGLWDSAEWQVWASDNNVPWLHMADPVQNGGYPQHNLCDLYFGPELTVPVQECPFPGGETAADNECGTCKLPLNPDPTKKSLWSVDSYTIITSEGGDVTVTGNTFDKPFAIGGNLFSSQQRTMPTGLNFYNKLVAPMWNFNSGALVSNLGHPFQEQVFWHRFQNIAEIYPSTTTAGTQYTMTDRNNGAHKVFVIRDQGTDASGNVPHSSFFNGLKGHTYKHSDFFAGSSHTFQNDKLGDKVILIFDTLEDIVFEHQQNLQRFQPTILCPRCRVWIKHGGNAINGVIIAKSVRQDGQNSNGVRFEGNAYNGPIVTHGFEADAAEDWTGSVSSDGCPIPSSRRRLLFDN